MNTATCFTRLTMIAAAIAAAVTVQAAPVASQGVVQLPTVTVIGKRAAAPQVAVVELPTVTVIGKRAPAATQLAVVELPMVVVVGKRAADAGTTLVAQKSFGAAPLKAGSRV